MNFYEHQDRARRSSNYLVLLFVVAVAAVVGAVGALTFFVTQGSGTFKPEEPLQMALGAGVLTLVVILLGTAFRFLNMRGGGRQVAESLGGRLIVGDSTDPEERRFLNILEEMSLAAGIPKPLAFVLDDEPGINAFAAGRSPEEAVVAVTRGTLVQLNRDELQGVIAHEYSHIVFGDMRLNMRIMGLIGGIMALSTIGQIMMRAGFAPRHSRSRKNSGGAIQIALLGLALLIIGYIGVLAGRLIQAAISRQREYLADASAVQFTRNPQGIAGALRKIAKKTQNTSLQSPAAAEARHMFFSMSSVFAVLATHPPLAERIRRVEGTPGLPDDVGGPKLSVTGNMEGEDGQTHFTGGQIMNALGGLGAVAAKPQFAQDEALADGQSPKRIPAVQKNLVDRALKNPLGAMAVVVATLLDKDEAKRDQQLAQLKGKANPVLLREASIVAFQVLALPRNERLALLDRALPEIRCLSEEQRVGLTEVLWSLANADGEVDVFEFCVNRIARRRLGVDQTALNQTSKRLTKVAFQTYSLAVLAALSQHGHQDPLRARQACQTAAARLYGKRAVPDYSPNIELGTLDQALDALATAPMPARRLLLEACTNCVLNDGVVTPEEAELLRAVATALDLPAPPFTNNVTEARALNA